MTGIEDFGAVDGIIESVGTSAADVVALLHRLQTEYGYLPESVLAHVADNTDITPAALESVATFYSGFRLSPSGTHRIKVCIGTACFVKGADQIFDAFRQNLGISGVEDTDENRLFTVEKVACLGCCMLAPAVQIDEKIYGHVTRNGVQEVLDDFLATVAVPSSRDPALRSAAPSGEVRLCTCTSCRASGSDAVLRAFEETIRRKNLDVNVKIVGCNGASYKAPWVEVRSDDSTVYSNVSEVETDDILERHFSRKLLGGIASSLLTRIPATAAEASRDGFLGAQVRIVTEGADEVSPLDLEEYQDLGGFSWHGQFEADGIITELKKSGLRGRGGAGYPTWRKWTSVKQNGTARKVAICNADEGDPGAFMDRMLLESFPFRVIEGLLLAALTVGADEAIFFVRAEYPQAVSTIEKALGLCEDAGLVRGIAMRVVEGAGAFVCGEETAMVAALEGRRPVPSWRPPYPSESGLNGRPTLIHNVETLATVPWIVRNGGEAFASVGTNKSPGTKTFALAGKVRRGGLVEIPLGQSIRYIVDVLGGGVSDGKSLKAVQIGGPSGGCVPSGRCDTTIGYESLSKIGSMMGSGGMIVLDETDCMVDIARYFMEFTQSESCGKCTCCRIGTARMLEILTRLCNGTAKPDDVETLKSLVDIVRNGSVCGLGQTAPNPVATTLEFFEDEYLAHLEGRCPAGKCRSLVRYFITDDCIGCTRCAQYCPVDAIATTPYKKHVIDPETCIRCGTCAQVCPSDAVKVR